MKQPFLILAICFSTSAYSQTAEEIDYFYSVKNNNDSTFAYFMSFLNKFDSTDIFKNFFCEKAAERVGDYYRSKNEFAKAIAYYDSTDTKYINRANFCGNVYYSEFITRTFKIAQCFMQLNEPQKALSVLTPYIFGVAGSGYFDSSMTEFYAKIVNCLYTKQQIENELYLSANKAVYLVEKAKFDRSGNYKHISFRLTIFGHELELAGYDAMCMKNGKIPGRLTKEVFTKQCKNLPIYKLLMA